MALGISGSLGGIHFAIGWSGSQGGVSSAKFLPTKISWVINLYKKIRR